jgi:hypothetical protein
MMAMLRICFKQAASFSDGLFFMLLYLIIICILNRKFEKSRKFARIQIITKIDAHHQKALSDGLVNAQAAPPHRKERL